MTILVTGAEGFIGKNLILRLREAGFLDVAAATRSSNRAELTAAISKASFVFHLAGVNRPKNDAEFATGNTELTRFICQQLQSANNRAPIVYTSSTQADRDNPYGKSKRAAEEILAAHQRDTSAATHLFRLPNVFGKWSRPNYNSAVATFCQQVAVGQEPSVNDPTTSLQLVYVDDVVQAFIDLLQTQGAAGGFQIVNPVYQTTVGDVATIIKSFQASRTNLITPSVGTGLERALHATYLSFLRPDAFTYDVPRYSDPRGEFVEMLKTADSGQFSYFTAGPGITRGDHYHHTKAEKFLVIRGKARFGFRHVMSGDTFNLDVGGGEGRIVETVPGWAHNITNVGSDELIVMLWANEIFDRAKPDTFAYKVEA